MKAIIGLLAIFLFSQHIVASQSLRKNESRYLECAQTTLRTVQCLSLAYVLGLLVTDHSSANTNVVNVDDNPVKYNFGAVCDMYLKEKCEMMEKCSDKFTSLLKLEKKYNFTKPQHPLILRVKKNKNSKTQNYR